LQQLLPLLLLLFLLLPLLLLLHEPGLLKLHRRGQGACTAQGGGVRCRVNRRRSRLHHRRRDSIYAAECSVVAVRFA
jgi:hypothetical protein